MDEYTVIRFDSQLLVTMICLMFVLPRAKTKAGKCIT